MHAILLRRRIAMLSRDDLQDLLDRMASLYVAGIADACAEMFTDDAQLHSSFGPPAIGRAEIRDLHRDWVAEADAKRFSVLDHGSTDTMAWCLCRFAEGDIADEGTSLIVLELQQNDAWLIRSCCLYGDPAPQLDA
jgi:hypothetical protein